MLALIEGHPNIDAVIFYILACAVLTVTLYRTIERRPSRHVAVRHDVLT
jgi:hypothetical protein